MSIDKKSAGNPRGLAGDFAIVGAGGHRNHEFTCTRP